MTQLVTVQTDFRDLEQMAEGLAGRVHATHVILPAGDSVDEGEWAQFEIALYDGSAGLAGMGRCVTVVDNGDERAAHQRFDVVFDSLQFGEHEQSVFEHILSLHGNPEQQVEEVSDFDAESLPPQAEESASFDVSTEYTGSQTVDVDEGVTAHGVDSLADVPRDENDDDEPVDKTMVATVEELDAVSDVDSYHPEPGGEANDAVPYSAPAAARSNGAGYGHSRSGAAHAVLPAAVDEQFEEPVSGERVAPITHPVNGAAFAYTNGIPFPAKPPRPQLDASLRVTPAPRPAGSSSH